MTTLPGPIVSADWLLERAAAPELRIVDLRWSLAGPPGRERYTAGHLPGAIFLDLDRDISAPRGEGPGRHPIPDGGRLAEALGAIGIGDRHAVIAYDDAGGAVAARLWWLFRHFGHDGQAAVLDGGLRAWTDAGGALTTDLPEHAPAIWTAHPPRTDDVVDAASVAALAGDPAALLVDLRATERYRGEAEPVDPRAGHIPGAVSLPVSELLDADGRLRPAAELRQRLTAAGADGRRPVVAYCGSGVNASAGVLAMTLAGIPARLYEGSWSDWSSDPDRPVAVGPEPAGEVR